MQPIIHKTWIELSANALKHNLGLLKSAAGQALVAPVLKANAYGHGLLETLSIIQSDPDIKYICLDSLTEAIAARNAGYDRGIVIIGYTPHATISGVIEHDCDQVVYDLGTAEILNKLAAEKGRKARTHIKVETGTMRQGVSLADLPTFVEKLKKLSSLEIVGVSTHFAVSEDPLDPMTHEQLQRFHQALDIIKQKYSPTLIHAACSAAALITPKTRLTMIRPGIALYGLYPSQQVHSKMLQAETPGVLIPVLSWKTIIGQIKSLPSDTPIGYSHTQSTSRDSTIAVLPVGYADGLDRGLSSKGFVLIHGKRANILGRICMNMCMVDITDIPECKLEDEVIIIGKQGQDEISADKVAELTQTIHYEVVARLNPKIPRLIV